MATPDGREAFEKILNVRDVGQHINHLSNQELLQSGLLFRGARPDAATPSDRQRLVKELGIKTVLDLRTPTEHVEQARKHAADIPSAPALTPSDPAEPLRIAEIEYCDVNLNGSGYMNALIWQLSYFQMAQLFGLYAFGWRKEAISVLGQNVMAERGLSGLAIDTLVHCKRELKEVFDVLCDASAHPVLVHCTQGKDRTGLVVLLVLLLCDVPRKAIDADYRMSESELAPEREEKVAEIRSIGLPDSFADCPGDWVETVCKYIDEACGVVEEYLESCGVGAEQQAKLKNALKVP
ncbi:hypothetical protein LTR37_005120 [Vermiconidia calcicola]|uniref:Uncharacterized protein n=1 Tax=Vermiconidia calcicola TaxID=1690605 RepID=A0ACC3NJT1_9PEZI|nr:hypothetical protein LTR37_005120 [Vermiconidia calcicola]